MKCNNCETSNMRYIRSDVSYESIQSENSSDSEIKPIVIETFFCENCGNIQGELFKTENWKA